MKNKDLSYMHLAIELARKAEGRTSPNPIVGAVIVKNDKIIGKGYHKKAGLPHAEINALMQAGKKAKGATLYVSLEPCDHFGRTGPCTEVIINSGIKKVVIGMRDPNPLNNGQGIKRLRKHGIKVVAFVLEKEAESINKPYIKFITKRMPYVTVKVAQSLDGKIATKRGDSKWISSEDSRLYVQKLRADSDAVMVGANTVLKDDPALLSRISGKRQPARIVVDGNKKIPPGSKVFSSLDISPVILASSATGYKKRADLRRLLSRMAKKGIVNILVEGGGELISSLVEKDLVDKMLIFLAPKIIGGRSAITSVEGEGVDRIRDAKDFRITSVKRFKNDILIEAER